ncbi:IS3 family transposase [Priestia aryabhattai]
MICSTTTRMAEQTTENYIAYYNYDRIQTITSTITI